MSHVFTLYRRGPSLLYAARCIPRFLVMYCHAIVTKYVFPTLRADKENSLNFHPTPLQHLEQRAIGHAHRIDVDVDDL
jgi:hypothetical protein